MWPSVSGSGIGYLYFELGQANASFQDTLNHNAALDAQAQNLRGTIARLDAEKDDLVTAKATLETSLTAAQTTNETLTGDLAAAIVLQDKLRTELGEANAHVHGLSEENRTLTHDKSVLAGRYSNLEQEHDQLSTKFTTLDQEYAKWRLVNGTVADLESKAGTLRTEIARLEERRRPLILGREEIAGGKCTGSMEPKLTCLDTATWLTDYRPEDIVVGAIISYQSRACRGDAASDGYVGHRVLDIRVIGGIYYYWPQGDANSGPDGCWVPHTAVDGYIIEVHKNTRPQNARLRNNVNAARVAYEAARNALPAAENAVGATKISLKAAENAYYRARDEYNSYLSTSISICSNIFLCQTYLVYVNQARERRDQALADWDRALDRFSRAVAHYEQAFARYEGARAYYDCWYSNAEDSEYPRSHSLQVLTPRGATRRLQCVLQQHGDGHRPDAARHRRDGGGHL